MPIRPHCIFKFHCNIAERKELTMFDTQTLDPQLVTFKALRCAGTKFEGYITIPLDEIYIPPMADNPARKNGKDPVNVNDLTQSLSHGIDYSLMPPTVRRCSRIVDGKHYKYELIAGNHRMEAFTNNKYDKWIFGVYEFAINGYSYEDSVRPFQLMENDHRPSLPASEGDVSNIIVRMIAHGSKLVTNDENSIRAFVDKFCKNKRPQTKGAIVLKVIRACGTYQDVVTYTAKDAFTWIAENTDYTVAGKLDRNRNKFGWTVLEGYQQEYVMNAIRKFSDTGKESYFVCHTKAPTDKMDLNDKRVNIVESFEQIETDFLKVMEFYNKNGRFPWGSEGFLPQDHKVNENTIVIV